MEEIQIGRMRYICPPWFRDLERKFRGDIAAYRLVNSAAWKRMAREWIECELVRRVQAKLQ